MKEGSLVKILNNFLFFGYEKGIFEAVEAHQISEKDGVTKLNPQFEIGMIENGGVKIDEYLQLLDENRYSAVFDNGDIISIQCRFEAGVLLGHRYIYLPCPFSEATVTSKPKHASLAEWLRDSAELEPRESFRSRGSFRFDCDREPPKSGDPHPVSHFTFSSANCRIPVRGPLQISAFLNFIFDNFFRDYRPVWLSYSSHLKLKEHEVTITNEEANLHHFNWEPSL